MRNTSLLMLLPRHAPPLSMMLSDLGNPSAQDLAKALGVHARTVERWMREDNAPRAALLSLFFITRWGWSHVHCHAENDARQQAALAFHLKCELDKANAQLSRLGQIGDFGSANDPAPGVPTTLAAPAAKQIKRPRGKTASQQRAELAEKRLTKRTSGKPRPFDFLRTG